MSYFYSFLGSAYLVENSNESFSCSLFRKSEKNQEISSFSCDRSKKEDKTKLHFQTESLLPRPLYTKFLFLMLKKLITCFKGFFLSVWHVLHLSVSRRAFLMDAETRSRNISTREWLFNILEFHRSCIIRIGRWFWSASPKVLSFLNLQNH